MSKLCVQPIGVCRYTEHGQRLNLLKAHENSFYELQNFLPGSLSVAFALREAERVSKYRWPLPTDKE